MRFSTKIISKLTNLNLEDIAQKVVRSNPDQVSAYLNGKDKLFGFFVGQIMKETQGKANPKSVNDILRRLLK